jgi:hypothetical protein
MGCGESRVGSKIKYGMSDMPTNNETNQSGEK